MKWIRFLISIILSVIFFVLAYRDITSTGIFEQWMLYFIALYIVYIILDMILIFLHEAGHYIFGKLTGYKFVSFKVLNLLWSKKSGKTKFRLVKRTKIAGQCFMLPPEFNEKMPYLLYNLGGVITNIVSLIIFTIVLIFTYNIRFVSSLFVLLVYIDFVHLFLNSIPIRSNYVCNDGYNILQIRKDPAALYSFWALLHINHLCTQDIRIKDMPDEYFKLSPGANMKYSLNVTINIFEHIKALDEHNFIKAKDIAGSLQSKTVLSSIFKLNLRLNSIFCELMINHNDVNILDNEIKEFLNANKSNISTCRFMYAWYLLVENNEKEADEQLRVFEIAAKKFPADGKSEVESERDLISYVKNVV